MISIKKSRCIAPTRPPKYITGNVTVILIGSKSNYRMRSYGTQSLFKVNDSILIEHQVEIIRDFMPNIEIILVTGFRTDKVLRKLPDGVRVIENCNYDNTNECEDVRLALNATLHDKVIIINNSLLFNLETLKQLPNASCIVIDSQGQIPQSEVGVTVVENRPTIFSYAITQPKWAQIASFINDDLILLKSICKNREKNKRFIFEAYNDLLEYSNNIKVVEPKGMKVTFLGTSKELKEISDYSP